MRIVDAHCHTSPYWYEPVESLLYHMERNSVAHAVLVQYMGQYNNSYQAECCRRYPERFASVVMVNAEQTQAMEELERLVEQGAKGLRLRADTRSPGDDPLALWRKAEALGLVVSCPGTKTMFGSKAFTQLVQAVPRLRIIIEHLGANSEPDGEVPPYKLRQNVFKLARFPNIYLKIPGLGEFCPRLTPLQELFPFERAPLRLLAMAYQAFGPDRLMWGSDYPPVSKREGYTNSLRLPLEQFQVISEDDRELIFGGTARRLFDFR